MKRGFIVWLAAMTFLIVDKTVEQLCTEQEPIHWNFTAVQTDEKFFEIHLRAMIDQPWHIFSQNPAPSAIAIPTKIHFLSNPMVKFVGKPAEQGEIVVKSDSSLGAEERYYEDDVIFIQAAKAKDIKTPIVVKGTVTYQLCNSETCKQPTTKEFTVILEPAKSQ